MTIPEHLRHVRLYSDREVSSILKRASELQDHENAEARRGICYEQIESFALEMGIEAEVLRAAAVELEQYDLEHGARTFWGGPFELSTGRIAPGALTPETAARLIEAVALLRPGAFHRSEDQLRWHKRSHLTGSLYIDVSSRETYTAIRLDRTFTHAAGFAYTIAPFLSLVGATSVPVLHHAIWVQALIYAGSLLLGLAAARVTLGLWIRRQRRRLKHLADHLRVLSSTSSL
ncbi:MAG: hypothetical protein SH809_01295 [Rhodothermales bacterium]|nr:hypothetical protein [Rhodothermales bacterium]